MEETTPPVGWCDWICNNAQSRAATCYLRFRRYTAFLQISNFKGGFLFYSPSKFGYTRETTRPRITQKGTSSLVPIPLPCFRLPLSISANLSSTYIRTPFPRFQQLHLLQPNFCFHFSWHTRRFRIRTQRYKKQKPPVELRAVLALLSHPFSKVTSIDSSIFYLLPSISDSSSLNFIRNFKMRLSPLFATIPLLAGAVASQTGQSQTIGNFGAVTVLYDSTSQNINYTMTVPSNFGGWFSIGDLNKMKGSNMMVSRTGRLRIDDSFLFSFFSNILSLPFSPYFPGRMGRQWESHHFTTLGRSSKSYAASLTRLTLSHGRSTNGYSFSSQTHLYLFRSSFSKLSLFEQATGEVTPTAAAWTGASFQSITSSVSDAGISVSWLSPIGSTAPSSSTPYIWASNSGNAPGSDPNAKIAQHPSKQRGHFTVNLLAPYTSPSTASGSNGASNSSSTLSPEVAAVASRNLKDASVRVQLAHVVSAQRQKSSPRHESLTLLLCFRHLLLQIVMSVAFLGVFPAGALIARYGRTYTSKWFPAHHGIQLFGAILTIVGFALWVSRNLIDFLESLCTHSFIPFALYTSVYFVRAVAWVAMSQGEPHFSSSHEKVGLALFLLVIVQVILGEVSHLIMVKKGIRTGYFHALLGVLIFILSIWEIQEGFNLWEWDAPYAATIFVSDNQ